MRYRLRGLDELHGQLDESDEDWSLLVLHGLGESGRRLDESVRVFPTFGHAWTRRVVWKLDESTRVFATFRVLEGFEESVNYT